MKKVSYTMPERYKKYEPLFGSWYIKGLIGEGSYGRVYEIERRDFGIYKSALKIISIPQSQAEIESARGEGMDEASLKSYYRSLVDEIVKEFAMMNKLKGTANVVSYEDHLVIPHEDGIGWDVLIRMELLTSLKQHLSTNAMTERDVIKLGSDICHALELCEKHKIIHRDIKPENIFISPNGDYKLGDFGIARTVESTMAGLSKKGTFFYMAPEVYRGGAYGSSVDIYSLGMVMYFLLNNRRHPFMPPSPQPIKFADRESALQNLMRGKPFPPAAHGSERLQAVIQKACEYSPENRIDSPSKMRELLDYLLNGDKAAASNIVLTPELSMPIGQFNDSNPSVMPDGPGTAMLDFLGDFDSDDATMAVTSAYKKVSNGYAPKKAPAPKQNPVNNRKQEIPMPNIPKPKKDGAGTKLLIGLGFAAVIIIFLLFILANSNLKLPVKNTEDEPIDEIEEPIETEPDDNNDDDDNNIDVVVPEEPKKPEKISLSATKITLEIGGTETLSVSVSPSGAEMGKIKWSSSDSSIAEVDENGRITAKSSGMAGITANMDGLTAICTVNVKAAVTVTGIEIASKPNKTDYLVGESLSDEGLALKVNYSDGHSETMTSGFSLSKEPFASAGRYKITISYSGFTATFEVNVTAPEAPDTEPEEE